MELEAKLGCPLPAAIREFLFWCGKGLGEIWRGARCLEYDELLSQFGLEEARASLAGFGGEELLSDGKVLLFQFDEDGQFSFVRLDGGDDPPVYTFLEERGLQRSTERFSEYVDLIIRQEFGQDGNGEPGVPDFRGPISSGPQLGLDGSSLEGTEPNAGPTEDANIIPPEQRNAQDLRETSFGFLPPSLQEKLGTLRASFVPSTANIFAGAVFGVLFLVLGLALVIFLFVEAAKLSFTMPVFAEKSISWITFAVAELLSLGMAGMGCFMLLKLSKTAAARIFVGDRGLCRASGSDYELLLWSDLVEIQELRIKDAAPLKHVGSLVPAGTDWSYNLRSKQGGELLFNSTNLRRLGLFREILARVATLYQVPWNVVESRRIS